MSKTCHLGHNVGNIYGLPTGGYYKEKETDLAAFDGSLKKLPYKYLTAITANKNQTKAAAILKKNKFKSIVTFYSSHESKDETLTLWFKEQKGKKPLPENKIYNPDYNCTVSYNDEDSGKYLDLSASKNNKGTHKRIDKSPVYYRVIKNKVVEEKYVKPEKSRGKYLDNLMEFNF